MSVRGVVQNDCWEGIQSKEGEVNSNGEERVAAARGGPGEGRVKAMRVGDRDYQLLSLLAEARCLSVEQVRRLFFPKSVESISRRRLKKLSEGPRPLLKRIDWYSRTGVQHAWGLTSEGYVEAERFLERELEVPRDDIGAEYLDHHVLLSELLVGLLIPQVEVAIQRLGPLSVRRQELATVYARALHPSFRWRVVGDRDLPWKQPAGAKLEARILRPDAFLEIPSARRRIFVESEMGTHTIVSASASKTGATNAKMGRYEAYCALASSPASRRSWYAERFQDGLKPEVLFLVRTAARQTSVERAVAEWRSAHPNSVCGFWVATVDAALAQLRGVVGVVPQQLSVEDCPTAAGAAAATSVGQLSKAELGALTNYFASAQAEYKARRDRARAAGQSAPDYPSSSAEVHLILERLRASGAAGSQGLARGE